MTERGEYIPPAPMPPSQFPRFFVGLLSGAFVSYGQLVLIFMATFRGDGAPPGPAYEKFLPFIIPAVIMLMGAGLAVRSLRWKAFGIGLLISVPFTAFVMFVICGR